MLAYMYSKYILIFTTGCHDKSSSPRKKGGAVKETGRRNICKPALHIIEEGGLKATQRVHKGETSYTCCTCSQSFSCVEHLKLHTIIHSREKSTRRKSFTAAGHLDTTTNIQTEKPYACSTCGKTFSGKRHLKRHTRIHTGKKPYTCSTCGKTFSDKGYLKKHMRRHTGEKPYTCSTCGKSFSDKGPLTRHTKIHTGEKPYTCSTCGKTFSGMKDT